MKRLKHWFISSACLGLITILLVSVGAGCASTQKTTKTETTVTYSSEESGNVGEQATSTSESTTTTTDTKAESPGIISSTFHAIGYVIALPFIIIGSVFTMIFGG